MCTCHYTEESTDSGRLGEKPHLASDLGATYWVSEGTAAGRAVVACTTAIGL